MFSSFLRASRNVLIGKPRDLTSASIGDRISLLAFLAWVGLGADGMSSSAYGPEEAYRALGSHTFLALGLAAATAFTVFVISYAYSRIIEHFPHGGGGYVVASALLGSSAGVVSGCALLVDYILTITVSIASGADAIFSLLPLHWQPYKLVVEFAAIFYLTIMNMRGVKESVLALAPIFLTFVITHVILIVGGVLWHVGDVPALAHDVHTGWRSASSTLGGMGMLLLFVKAYSLGAGTYTGIEAVSNGLGIMREPRVETGKRTMRYMAISLAATAAGLLVCYMLFHVRPVEGRTLNTVLAHEFFDRFHLGHWPIGSWFAKLTILSEAVLLLVAAQSGFIDGPRVMANMAADGWLPRRFMALSDRLTVQNGVLVIGMAAAAALLYTRGNVAIIVVMYSINVFLTFSLSELGMVRFWVGHRRTDRSWWKHLPVHATGLLLCASILVVMLAEKFTEGGWITLAITGVCIGMCILVRRHYRQVAVMVKPLDDLAKVIDEREVNPSVRARNVPEADPAARTAVILVNGYNGLGLHTLLAVIRMFPGVFKNFVFMSVGIVDSGNFKGEEEIHRLRDHTRREAERYVALMHKQGVYAQSMTDISTDAVDKVTDMAKGAVAQFPNSMFFGGQVVFPRPSILTRLLHNSFVFAAQHGLYREGYPFLILPIRL